MTKEKLLIQQLKNTANFQNLLKDEETFSDKFIFCHRFIMMDAKRSIHHSILCDWLIGINWEEIIKELEQ